MKKNNDLNPDRKILVDLVTRLEPLGPQILVRWERLLREKLGERGEVAYKAFCSTASFPVMIKKNRSLKAFYKTLSEAADNLNRIDLTYRELLLVLQLFKESCYPFITREGSTAETLQGVFVSLDRFYHNVLSESALSWSLTSAGDGKRQGEMTEQKGVTKREAEIIKWVAEGYKNREIALQLGISVKTVETHRANIMNKLGIRNLSQLIRYALLNNLINIDET